MIKSILILVLILINLSSSEANAQFKKISKLENTARLEKCGLQDIGVINELPWIVRIWLGSYHREKETNGVLISPIHVLTRYTPLENYKDVSTGPCKNNISIIIKKDPEEQLKVEFQKCIDAYCKPPLKREERKVVKELIIGSCAKSSDRLVLLELENDVPFNPVCLPENTEIPENGAVRVVKFHMPTTRTVETTAYRCGKGMEKKALCTQMQHVTDNAEFWKETQNDFPMLSLQGTTLYAFSTFIDKKRKFAIFQPVLPIHEEMICEVTGVCKVIVPPPPPATEPPTEPPTTTTTLATMAPSTPKSAEPPTTAPGATQKSRIIEDWPPPIPTIRPPVRVTPVDFLPQNKEDYDDEEQLLLEYEQIEREEREKEEKMEKMEKKKGSEGWNVLMGVGITVLIGLI